jgi:hypothetical protein
MTAVIRSRLLRLVFGVVLAVAAFSAACDPDHWPA